MSHRLTGYLAGAQKPIPMILLPCLVALLVVPAAGVMASEGQQSSHEAVLEAIQTELKKVQQENRVMRDELDLLQAENSQDWLTEQRAEEIKGLVGDVLADADTRSSLVGNGLMAGWSEHFFLASADGRFLLRLGALMQNRFILNWRESALESTQSNVDNWVYGFETTTARLNLSGHVFGDDIQYRLSLGYGRLDPYRYGQDDTQFGTRLYEAWTRFRITDEWSVRMGLMKSPFTRETLVYEGRQLAVERSTIDMRLGLGRSVGVELDYTTDEMRGMLSINSGSGAYFGRIGLPDQTPPFSWSTDASDLSIQGRMEFLLAGEWSQFKQFTSPPGQDFGMMLGIAGGALKQERTVVGNNSKNDVWLATADVSVMYGGASLFAAFIYANQINLNDNPRKLFDNVDWYGVVVQGSVYLDEKIELYARYEYGGPTSVVGNLPPPQLKDFTEPVSILMVGTNYYIDGQDVKLTVDAGISFNPMSAIMTINQTGWREEPEEHDAQFLLRAQMQLMF
ncbi:MAG TPA: hypothetical protein DEO57_06450 [Phycisphaerales bacterium]|nr:hypothetical protein [Phycisphaerales bacterium]